MLLLRIDDLRYKFRSVLHIVKARPNLGLGFAVPRIRTIARTIRCITEDWPKGNEHGSDKAA
jgi:hypothetical protein